MPSYELLMCLLVGGAFGSAGWIVMGLLTAPRRISPELGRFEEVRREEVRQVSSTYRVAEPMVYEWIGFFRGQFGATLDMLQRDLPSLSNKAPWQPAEFLATKKIEGLLVAAGSLLLTTSMWSTPTAVCASGVLGVFYVWITVQDVKSKATRRRNKIRRRFPPVFDLVSLMLSVGANFQEAIETVVKESDGDPLGEELQRMLQDTEMGRMREDSLKSFSERLGDDDIAELMTAVVEAEKLGTPIADIMQTQIEQIRQKRVQWAEKLSEQSKVTLVFPIMLILLACLFIVAAPFLLEAVLSSKG